MILPGQPVADRILADAKSRIGVSGRMPGLGVVLVGDDPASRIYVGLKEKRARELGIHFVKTALSEAATQQEILASVETFNSDPMIHGILVQLPLPKHLDADRIIAAIDPKKDADGFLTGVPVFPEAMMELAKSSGITFQGKRGMAIVKSERLGRSIADLLRSEGVVAEYIFSEDIGANRSSIGQADVVFSAVGSPGILPVNMFKDGAVVIDGGISKVDGNVVGDVPPDGNASGVYLSPVPGGVGPVTVACLLRRVVLLSERTGPER